MLGLGFSGSAAASLGVLPPGDPSGLGFHTQVSTTQAGGHPNASTRIYISQLPTLAEFNQKGAPLKDTVVDLPPGVIGNPEVGEKCTPIQMQAGVGDITDCPVASQVGIAEIRIGAVEAVPPVQDYTVVPLYVLEPAKDQLAALAFKVGPAVATIEASLRPSDNGVRLTVRSAPQIQSVAGVTVTVWGVPADPSHDLQRCHQIDDLFYSVSFDGICGGENPRINAPLGNPGITPKAFFSNPTVCDEPKVTSVRVSSWWMAPAGILSPPVFHALPTPTGCDRLSFDPEVQIRPTSAKADAPTGLSVDLDLAQSDGAQSLATSHLKDVTVRLPEGLTISPSAAAGLAACTDEQLGAGTSQPVACPEASKIGSVVADTPALPDPLHGSVYAGAQRSQDPESGEMFRLFMVVRGPGDLQIKLVGRVKADSRTGRLETTFLNNPQLPVAHLSLQLKSGPRAPLATPPVCGTKTVSSALYAWGGQARVSEGSFGVDCPGVSGFALGFAAGTLSPSGGRFSPFVLRLNRPDGEEFVDGLTLRMPSGVTARLRDVPLCPDGPADHGTCPVESRVGSTTVGAGPGPSPFFLRGSVSLTGPYKGAPYGLSAAVRVIAGPFDLGTVVVRQAIFVDPDDAHITVVSDPVPTIIAGVPVRLRTINVDVDRPQFVINPTSCAEKTLAGVVHSQQTSVVKVTTRFQAADCQALSFRPKLALTLTGRQQVAVGKHPGLRARIAQQPGQANIRKVEVRLPLSLALDPDNANGLCEFAEGHKVESKCPRSSVIGTASAVTPLLNRPLKGRVYFVKNVRRDRRTGRLIRTLPTLLVPLRGDVSINLRATTAVKGGKLVSTFAETPDAPVLRFELNLKGGRGGILVVTGNRSLCRVRSQSATVLLDGHNGKRREVSLGISRPCSERQRGTKSK